MKVRMGASRRFAINEVFCVLSACFVAAAAGAEEIVKERRTLPGASLEQEVRYSTSRADYNEVRDAWLARLRKGDASALQNPVDGPWKEVTTTAMIGIEIPIPGVGGGAGAASGRETLRRVTAAEEALFIYERE